MKMLRKEKLDDLLSALSADAAVFVPKTVDGVRRFALYTSAEPTEVGVVANTTLPPKDLLFPQTQKMYDYGMDADGRLFVKDIDSSTSQLVFGIRSCDMASIRCLDEVFLTKGFVDNFYEPMREKLLTVALGCTEPAETCFCDSMGVDPNCAPNADIQLRDAGDCYTVEAQTEKGAAALAAWEPYLEEGDAQTEDVNCALSVPFEGVKQKLDHMFDDPIWDEISAKCLNCGVCTFECPTCHCFDIDQENRMKDGYRFRCWDSCMFSEYTAMAGGHNPRPTKKERVRNRFMHKLNYFEDRYGIPLCVGCGRCVADCPVGLDITVLIDRIAASEPAVLSTGVQDA
jgi:sulfhydrogenase subunit beta (sulfur reductase)